MKPRCSALLTGLTPCLCSDGRVRKSPCAGKTVHTMAGPPIENGMVVIQDGKISAIGVADQIAVPEAFACWKPPW